MARRGKSPPRASEPVRAREPRPGRDDYPPSESIGLLMRIALFGLRATFKERLAAHGVPWSAWYYLRVLWEHDSISQRELTERVGVMQPNTVSALRQMEHAGLVSVARSDSDRRRTLVSLTPKARRLMARLLPEITQAVRPVALAGFTKKEEAELRRMLVRICDNVQSASRTKP